MKKWNVVLFLSVMLVLLVLNSCGEGNMVDSTVPLEQGQGDQQPKSTPSPTPSLNEDELQLSSRVTEGDFELILYTEKTHYEVDEPIKVYADLIYNGDQEQIEIGHSMYPIGFDTSEHTRSLYMMGAMNEPYIVTTLKQGEPMRYEYNFTGGYNSDEDEQYIDFINDLIDNQFPEGNYTVTAHANFSEHVEESDESQTRAHYSFSGSISFIVGD